MKEASRGSGLGRECDEPDLQSQALLISKALALSARETQSARPMTGEAEQSTTVEYLSWEHIVMRKDERHDGMSPIVILCFLVMLLAVAIGAIVELSGGKGSLLWELSSSLFMLAGAIIGIHMIVTRRAFYKGRDYVGKNAVVVGSLCLLVLGSLFICFIVDTLSASP